MRKLVCFALAALLLCGTVACKAPKPEPSTPMATLQPMPVGDVAAAMEKAAQSAAPTHNAMEPTFDEDRARPLTSRTDGNTMWSWFAGLTLYADGTGRLEINGDRLWLTERDGVFDAQLRMYRLPYGAEPAYAFPAGKLRILTDGEAVRFEVLEDPLGAFACAGLDGKILKKSKNEPSPDSGWTWTEIPVQPDTDWGARLWTSEIETFHIDETLAMNGTVTTPDGTQRACAILGNRRAVAIVDETEGAPALLFYGECKSEDYRQSFIRLTLKPICDPYDLCRGGKTDLTLFRTGEASETDLRYMAGRNLDSIRLQLVLDGWTDETDRIGELDEGMRGWFARLTKDGQTILILYELDFESDWEEAFAAAYVHYDADGTVLAWMGTRPVDHAIADGYTLQEDAYFSDLVDGRGALFDEDETVYFLDDGRIAIVTVWHESGDGDCDFRIVNVLPQG